MCIKKITILLIFSLILFVSSAQAEQVKFNGTQYYEKLDGTMTTNPSIITETPLGYRIDWLGMYYFITWDGINAYDTFNYLNGTFVSPWIMPRVEYWRITGQKRWVEVIPINNTFEQNNNQIIRRMTMGDGSLFNITYTATDKIKYTWDFTAEQNQNYSIVLRMDSAASEDINPTSKRYTPGWFSNRTFYSYGDIQEPYASNISSWYEAGDRKFFQRIILGQQAIGNSTEIDPSIQFNGSTTPPWQNGSSDNTWNETWSETGSIILNYSNVPIWNVTYDMKSVNASGWTESGTQHWRTSDGKVVNITSTGSTDYEYHTTTTGNSPNYTLEARIQNVNTPQIGALILQVVEASRRIIFSINNTNVCLWNGVYICIDMITNDSTYHTYRIHKNVTGGVHQVWLYIDENKTSSITTTSFSANTNNIFRWGDGSATAGATVQGFYDYILFTETNTFGRSLYYSSGNRTQWHDFGAGRQGANMMFNFTNSTNTFIDAYASTDNFTSSNVLVADNITNATWTAIPASAKNQTQYVRAVLKGNTTSTPELMEVLIEDEAVSEEGAVIAADQSQSWWIS